MAAKKHLGTSLDGMSTVMNADVSTLFDNIENNAREKGQQVLLKVEDIRPNPYQPRRNFDQAALEELAASIKEHGVFQPIIVRESKISGYELIAGERRLRASKLAGLSEIPAFVVEYDDKAMMEISLLENLQREDLSAIEEANAYQALIDNLGYTQEQLAKRMAKSRSNITNVLRLLKLPSDVQALIDSGMLSYGHGRALVNITDEEKLLALAKRAVKEELSVREVERLAQEQKTKLAKTVKTVDPYLSNVQHTLESRLGMRVDLSSKQLTIHYKGTEQLNELLELLNCLEEN